MAFLANLLLRRLLPVVVGRACPSSVNRVGGDAESVNCFNTFVEKGDEAHCIVLLSIEGMNVTGLEYDGDRYAIECLMPLANIDPSDVRITHYYGTNEVVYQGIWDLAWGLGLRLPYAYIWFARAWDAIAQRLFNRRSLVLRNRLQLLRSVIRAYNFGHDPVSATDVLSNWHGERWAGHPRWLAHHDHVQRMLEMLAESGELVDLGTGFRPAGLALRAIEEAEEQDRKHKANFRIQVLLAIVAAVGLVMAGAQAGLIKLPMMFDASMWLRK